MYRFKLKVILHPKGMFTQRHFDTLKMPDRTAAVFSVLKKHIKKRINYASKLAFCRAKRVKQ